MISIQKKTVALPHFNKPVIILKIIKLTQFKCFSITIVLFYLLHLVFVTLLIKIVNPQLRIKANKAY